MTMLFLLIGQIQRVRGMRWWERPPWFKTAKCLVISANAVLSHQKLLQKWLCSPFGIFFSLPFAPPLCQARYTWAVLATRATGALKWTVTEYFDKRRGNLVSLLMFYCQLMCLLPGFPRGFLLIRQLYFHSIYRTVYILLMSLIFNLVAGNDFFRIYEFFGHSWALIHSKIVREGPKLWVVGGQKS